MCEVFLKFSFIHTLFSYCCYSIIPIEKTSLIQYNKVSGRYLYEGKILIIEDDLRYKHNLKLFYPGMDMRYLQLRIFPEQ